MTNNLFDVYNYKGLYFDEKTLPILIATTRRGNKGEQDSLIFFKNELLKKGIQCVMISPTPEEDLSGIDGKFIWNGKELTIQVKPYDNIMENDGLVSAYSQGSLSLKIVGSSKNVDYLVLYKLEKNSFIIVRSSNTTVQGNLFKFPKDKIISMK